MTINEIFWNSWDRPYRHAITEAIASLGAPRSILEIGCHCGPNFLLWRRRWPTAHLIGIDRNPRAVAYGREQWSEDASVQLQCSDIIGATLPSADVAVSCYALAYVPPADIDAVVGQLWKSARLGLVIAEPMAISGHRVGPCGTTPPEWRHDFPSFGARPQIWRVDPPVDRMNGIAIMRRAP